MQPRPPAARTAAFGLPRGRQAAASAGLLDDSVLTGTPLARPWVVAFPLFGEPTGRTAIAAKSEISKDKSGKFRFHLKTANGEIIAASLGYETKESAHKGIESVKTNAPDMKVVDLTEQEPRAQLARIAVCRRTPRTCCARATEVMPAARGHTLCACVTSTPLTPNVGYCWRFASWSVKWRGGRRALLG